MTALLQLVFGVLGCAALLRASPFELVDKYLNEYYEGIDQLKKLSEEYKPPIEDYIYFHYNETEAHRDATEYDFIIVGGGTSGSVIANRLSEIPEWKVLLIEAGGEETPITEIPAFWPYLPHTPYSWKYKTPPQKHWCYGSEDHKCMVTGGKVLGGTSAVNQMFYTRGNHRDYDLWADKGNEGWCFTEALSYYKKIEDAHLAHFDRRFHHLGGPVHLENPQFISILREPLLAAAKDLELPVVDYNGKNQLGLGVMQSTTKLGKRHSAAQAYLTTASHRHNLIIKTKSQVTQILVSPHTKEATGVKYLHQGKLFIAKASKEVIVAGGAINTPHLLILSGIGPKDLLEKHDIQPLVDLSVGHGLKDQLVFSGLTYVLNETSLHKYDERENLVEYLHYGKGPLTALDSDVVAFFKTKLSKDVAAYPDIQLTFKVDKVQEHVKTNIKNETHSIVVKTIENKYTATVNVILLHPKSTGWLKVYDRDPLHQPYLDLNHLSDEDEHDLETLLEGVRLSQRLMYLLNHYLGIHEDIRSIYGCEKYGYDTDQYWKCAIQHTAYSLRQISGTAKMGPDTDPHAVVDNKLVVHGMHKLRIADPSVIPVTISGNLMAVSYFIGEKAADLIKHHWL